MYHFVAKQILYYNKIIKTTVHNLIMGILIFKFHQKKKATIFIFTLLPYNY